MTHDASVSTLRFERMPPQAMALALLFHALVAFALWQMSLQAKRLPPPPEPIEVTIEQPPPPPPKVEPPKQEQAKPAEPTPPVTPGLRPPAEITAENPTQVPPLERQALERAIPQPPPEPLAPTERAFEAPQQSASAAPRTEPAKPEPPRPPPPAQARPEPPRAEPPRPTPPQQQAPQRPAPAPPANQRGTVPAPPPQNRQEARPQPPALAPSPLDPSANHSTRAAPRPLPPYVARMEERTSSSAFVNPADSYNRARVADNYLWQVVRKLVGYKYQAPGVDVDEAVTVVRVIIGRDGRLLDVQVAQSSGIPQIDAGVIGGVRRGSPYAPLPDSIQGASATFYLPLVSVNRQ